MHRCRWSRVQWRENCPQQTAFNLSLMATLVKYQEQAQQPWMQQWHGYMLLVNLVHTPACAQAHCTLYLELTKSSVYIVYSYCSASVQKTVAWLLLLPCIRVFAVMCMIIHTVCWGPCNLLDQHRQGISMLVLWLSYCLHNIYPWKSCDFRKISWYIPGCRDVNTLQGCTMIQVWMNVWDC